MGVVPVADVVDVGVPTGVVVLLLEVGVVVTGAELDEPVPWRH